MKMSAARIRSVFRRHSSVQEQVFRSLRNVRPPASPAVSKPTDQVEPQAIPSRLEALNQHYQSAMKRELARPGL